jgi:hypothetical protein
MRRAHVEPGSLEAEYGQTRRRVFALDRWPSRIAAREAERELLHGRVMTDEHGRAGRLRQLAQPLEQLARRRRVKLNDYEAAIFLAKPGTELMGVEMLRQYARGTEGPVAAMAVIQLAITAIVLGIGAL